jgi:ATP synthase protein I
MGAPDDRRQSLDDLGTRITAARDARKPKKRTAEGSVHAASLAWRMVTELVVGVMLGGAIGWGLDSLFGTLPAFLIVFGILGFVAGVKTMVRSAAEVQRKDAEARAKRDAPDDRS